MRIFSQTQDLLLFECSNYFCWRIPTSIYFVSDQKLPTGARGFGVADNMTANTLAKNIQSVWKWQIFCNISQTFECLALHFVRQVAGSQPDTSLAKIASNVSAGGHLKNRHVQVKDTHLMNNNQSMAEIMCGDC